jgi:hypothetical protein
LQHGCVLAAVIVAAGACADLGGLTWKSGAGGADGGDIAASPITPDGGCAPGFATCPSKGPGACNTAIATDRDDCGACDSPCVAVNTIANPVCADAKCLFQCASGFADCNGDGRDGCEAALASDPHDCGACGHDCQGGACTAGTCQPIVVGPSGVGSDFYPSPLAVDTAAAFWFANTDVASCAKSGCSKASLVSTGGLAGTALAIDAASVFFTGVTDDKLRSVPRGGGAATVIASTLQPQAHGIAADGTNVYFTVISDLFTGLGRIMSCPRTGCGGGSPVPVSSPQGRPQNLLVSAGRLLWTSSQGAWKCTLPACVDATKLVSAGASSIATDGTTLYLAAGTSVLTCPLAGCSDSPAPLVAGGGVLAVDDATVYFAVNEQTGPYSYTTKTSISSCPKSGCTAPKLVLDGFLGTGIDTLVADGAFLYWANGTDLVRLVKP